MFVLKFPDPWTTETTEDVIAVGGKLSVENIQRAYNMGIFPWPHEGYPLLWFCPMERGVLDFQDLHVGRSLKKWLRKNESSFQVTFNTVFAQVIKECGVQERPGQNGSWITPAIEKNYTLLNQAGGALSVECWQDDQLISGIYGVQSDKYFSCESMFFKKSNTSKLAFLKLVEYLRAQGQTWMDLQMVTDVSGAFGGKYISKRDFLKRIR